MSGLVLPKEPQLALSLWMEHVVAAEAKSENYSLTECRIQIKQLKRYPVYYKEQRKSNNPGILFLHLELLDTACKNVSCCAQITVSYAST